MSTPTTFPVDIHDIRTLTATGPIDLPAAPSTERTGDRSPSTDAAAEA